MKKVLLLSALIAFSTGSAYAINPTFTAPNASTMDFYPMMRNQMEKEETLDFINNPEAYKDKREIKDTQYQMRNSNFNPNYTPNYGGRYLHTIQPATMQFTKGSDGQIKIQGSNPQTIKNEEKSE